MVFLSNKFFTSAYNYFVTTPIFYANGAPHIGHLYTAFLADAACKWECVKKDTKPLFATGTDEHGAKIQSSAQLAGVEPKIFCDRMSATFKDLFDQFRIEYTDYIRTTEQRHREAVAHFWKTLDSKGYIYKDSYAGWYSTVDEAFYRQHEISQVERDGSTYMVSESTGSKVEWVEEENYMFALSHFRTKLFELIKNTDFVQPPEHVSQVLDLLKTGGDVSVSRDRRRLRWGLQVPDDPNQTIYVWLDALINYLTVAGYPQQLKRWPPDCQIIGHDILRFHSIFWPAFLMAAELPIPKKLYAHGHWTVEHIKMSKSLGNIVDPITEAKTLATEGLRYFLLRRAVPHENADYISTEAVAIVNAELANTFGNLLSRSAKFNTDRIYPTFDKDIICSELGDDGPQLIEALKALRDSVAPKYDDLFIMGAVDDIMSVLRRANAFFQDHQPWTLKNSPEAKPKLDAILHLVYETLRVTAILLQPVVPELCNKLLSCLAVAPNERTLEHATYSDFMCGRPLVSKPAILFKRIKVD